MSRKTAYSDGSRPLDEFQEVAQQQEGIFGPLVALGNEGDQNTMTFDIGNAPGNRVILEEFEGESPNEKLNHKVVCTGLCLVKGSMKKIVAYR